MYQETNNNDYSFKNNIIKTKKCKIQEECKHEWIDDLIDLDPDKSKIIYYCIICLETKK
jgi:hypothetical protein